MGLVTGPHARSPRTHCQWVAGPGRPPERTSCRGWESARPQTPHTQAGGAPPRAPSCRPHSGQSGLARAHTAGLGTGPYARTPRTHGQWVVGPGRTPQRMGGRGWESARPRTPRQEAPPPPGTLMPPPQSAKPARKSARCGGGDGSPHLQPLHPQPVENGPRLHARKNEWSGSGERPTPDAPHPGKRRPPRAPSCRPHNAQSQLAGARCGVGDGSPRPQTPHPKPVVSGPRRMPQRTGGRGWESARPWTPHTQARGPPRWASSCRPHNAQSHLATAHAVGLVKGLQACTPRTHSQWLVSPGRTPQRTGCRGRESARPRTPRQEAPPPPGTFMPLPQPAKSARKSARGRVGDRSPRPHLPHPQQVGSGPGPHARKDEWLGVGERLTPDAPHSGKRRPRPRGWPAALDPVG